MDLVKINVDANIDENRGVFGFGIIARNYVGDVLAASSVLSASTFERLCIKINDHIGRC